MKKTTTITIKMKRAWRRDRYLSEPQKAYPTGEFIIVAKLGGHALRHLASRLANVIRQGGRQTKNRFLKKNPYLNFYNCCTILCTISGFSSIEAVY